MLREDLYNLSRKYFKGLHFKVYMDGTVKTKQGKEIGYISKEYMEKIESEILKGFALDKLVKKYVVIPINIRSNVSIYFKDIKKKIKPLRKVKKKPWITMYRLNKYKNLLTELEYEIMKKSIKGQNAKTIGHQLGIKDTTVNTYKHSAKKKIYGEKSKRKSKTLS